MCANGGKSSALREARDVVIFAGMKGEAAEAVESG
jgi:hypothetical protein